MQNRRASQHLKCFQRENPKPIQSPNGLNFVTDLSIAAPVQQWVNHQLLGGAEIQGCVPKMAQKYFPFTKCIFSPEVFFDGPAGGGGGGEEGRATPLLPLFD